MATVEKMMEAAMPLCVLKMTLEPKDFPKFAAELGALAGFNKAKLEQVQLWLNKHAAHAGFAPLSLLQEILDADDPADVEEKL
jgi:hypothetical protein